MSPVSPRQQTATAASHRHAENLICHRAGPQGVDAVRVDIWVIAYPLQLLEPVQTLIAVAEVDGCNAASMIGVLRFCGQDS